MIELLMQFRTGRTAVKCDIKNMFHLFHFTSANRDYLWFPWITSECATELYRLKVHLFRAKSLPRCATYRLQHLALQGKLNDGFIYTTYFMWMSARQTLIIITVMSTVQKQEKVKKTRENLALPSETTSFMPLDRGALARPTPVETHSTAQHTDDLVHRLNCRLHIPAQNSTTIVRA